MNILNCLTNSFCFLFCYDRHGQGQWVNPNGDCYKGDFVYDARHGRGTYTWKNGNVYRGDFFEDKRQGKVCIYVSEVTFF